MGEPLLELVDVCLTYERRRVRRKVSQNLVVSDFTLTVAPGQSVAIVGESGSGKSTVARAIAGLLPVTSGEIRFDGTVLPAHRSLADARNIQMVFQDPYSSLNPRITVADTLAEVIRVHRNRPRREVESRVSELLDLVNLPASSARAYARHLSGGQRQRVSIARALAAEPRLLLADEPTSALDVSVQAAILNLFADLREELGLAIVMISHSLAVVRQVSQWVAVVYRGRIVEQGPTASVLDDPQHSYTRALLDSVPSIVPRELRQPVEG